MKRKSLTSLMFCALVFFATEGLIIADDPAAGSPRALPAEITAMPAAPADEAPAVAPPHDKFRIVTDNIVASDTFNLTLSGATKGTLAVAGGPSAPSVAGAVSGDMILSAMNQNIVFSADSGSSTHMFLSSAGRLGIGTAAPSNLFTINSAATPAKSQFAVKANGFGALSGIVYSADNVHLGFDADYDSGWKARDASVARFTKSSGYMILYGSAGNVVGASAILNPYWTVDLTNGNVGVGTPSAPLAKLEVNGGIVQTGAGLGVEGYTFIARRSSGALGYPDIYGKVGGLVLGSGAPASVAGAMTQLALNVDDATLLSRQLILRAPQPSPTGTGGQVQFVNSAATSGYLIQNSGVAGDSRLQFTRDTLNVMTLDYGGNVGIGTITPQKRLHVAGDIQVDGNINAKFQDIAEWVPAGEEMESGTIVVIAAHNHVVASSAEYDTRVAGVVSPRPGLTLGEAGAEKALIATTGRVRVKADASSGPIREGDLLVSSPVKGTAMRSEPIVVNGRRFHQPGTIIGKALEPLESGQGSILVLLSLQ